MAATSPEPKFPYKQLATLSVCLVAQGLALQQLFSYAGFLVMHYGLSDRNNAGYYAGNLAAAFMVGRMVSSYPMGALSDYWGRKPVMYISLVCLIVCNIGFGFSTNYYMALGFRVGLGLFNGIVVVAKTMVSEVCVSRAHETRGMGVITLSWYSSMLVAPGMAGLLYGHGIFGSEKTYPQLLPNLVCAFVAFLGMVGTYLWLPETATNVRCRCFTWRRDPRLLGRSFEMSSANQVKGDTATEPSNEPSSNPEQQDNANSEQQDQANSSNNRAGVQDDDFEEGTSILRNGKAWMYLFLYCSFSLSSIAYDEVFNLWTIVTQERGGLGWEASQVGTSLSVAGFGVVLFTMFIYTPFTNRFGTKWALIYACVLSCPAYVLTPSTPKIVDGPTARFLFVTFIMFVAKICGSVSFAVLALLVNRCVVKELRGRINGVSMCVGSLAKAIGPAAAAPAFAWALIDMNSTLPVFIGCAVLVLASVFVFWISIRKRKRPPLAISQTAV